ncbi:MAG TPA: RluA family pseudouridine synthase [Candidatus Paceibacterota bacterium]|nr:RluA family pseudouridine synthase [Candidatus Paceibacterota bacterium]
MDLEIIYEDADLVAVNKPPGLTVHKTSAEDPQTTLADLAVRQWPEMAGVGEDPLRPGIVHRLDRDTSGIILLAKTQEAFAYLKSLFKERHIRKTYLALVNGSPNEPFGTVDLPVARIGAKTTTRTKGTRELVERSAVTDWKIRARYAGYTLLECMPRTGRTHQIRAHLKSLGTPIAGDPLYSAGKPVPAGLDRPFLHAWKLEFTSPPGTALALEADLPSALQKVLDALQSAGV